MGYPQPPPRKLPTGSGVIGQTGNKPGGSVYGAAKGPRPGLTDPRPISGPEIERLSDNVTFAVCVAFAIWLATAVIGFILGRML